MKMINYRYESKEKLEAFLADSEFGRFSVFIQLFSGVSDRAILQEIVDTLFAHLPGAALIGATTAGEIIEGRMADEQIILSFSLFEATQVRTYHYSRSDFDNGVRAAREILTERTKACIFLSEGIRNDSESFLNGFASVRSDVMVAGGNAGDNHAFSQTYVMAGEKVYDAGISVAVLDSDILQVHNAYSLNWTPVGREMTVTKADHNVIYEIDGMPVRELYVHYLGEETVARIPASAIEFPLVKMEDGVRIARSIIAQTDDGGFVYAGHFHEGDKVFFAIGNVEEIMNHAPEIRRSVASAPAEATYIYSCSVRKLFLQEQLNYEFGLINEIAPTAGFFTYGEFFHSPQKNQLLNITTTTLSLSETEMACSAAEEDSAHEYRHTMLKSLTHLINKTQEELNESIRFLDQYKMVLDESSIVSKTDTQGLITYVNDAFCKASGYTREELVGRKHSIIHHPDAPLELFADLWQTIKAGKVWKNTFKNRAKDGSEYYLKTVIVPIFNEEGTIVEHIAASVDVSELMMKERIILRQLTDDVTGLKNRTALFADLEEGPEMISLAVLNIDRFSNINDYFGYEIGDTLLEAFAAHLKQAIWHANIYRISGDEFAFICIDEEYGDRLKERIIDHVNAIENRKFSIGDYEFSVNVSCGVAHASVKEVYNLAHIALKEAKEQRGKVIFFNDNKALAEKTRNNIMVVNKIKSAIAEDRIVPYFQGIVDNRTRQIVKYESLMRMVDTDGTVLSPYWFLEHAKKSKLYDKLTRIMISKTFEAFKNLEYDFSLNLTLQDIISDETRTFLYDTLRSSPAASRLVFEIVESEGIESFDEVAEFIRTVKQYGCRIAIDDFGTGYSNFSYLSKLDVDYIKIDGSLIKNINRDEDHRLTVESILHFAQRKQIKTIAEFVEDETIFAKLTELGIEYSQGYLFSTPAPHIAR